PIKRYFNIIYKDPLYSRSSLQILSTRTVDLFPKAGELDKTKRKCPERHPLKRKEVEKAPLESEAIVHLDGDVAHAHGAVVLAATALLAALLVIVTAAKQFAQQTVFTKETVENA